VRSLEQRLEGLRTQNDSLVKQNLLYRSEIENYQTRLLEKEKMILLLVNQKKELVGGS